MPSEDAAGEAKGLSFPAMHTLIAMGPPGKAFADSVLAALRAAGARLTDLPPSSRLSRTGRYQSLHILAWVESRAELEALYVVLKAHPDVVFRL